MKHAILLSIVILTAVAGFARNDFWIGCRYSVSLTFGADDLGKKNAPTPKVTPPPEYPSGMIQPRIEGEVTVDYTVDLAGRLSDVTIVKASAEEFRKSVSAVVSTWAFNPAIDTTTGKPVPARMRCKIRFSIVEEAEPNQSLQPTAPSGRG
jgi:TonB family protein